MKKYILIILGLCLFGLNTQAAQISLEAPKTQLFVGDEILIKIFLNTENEEINAIDLGILFPPLLSVHKISKTGSAIQLWVKEPSFTTDAVLLSGGIPSGIRGSHILIATIQAEAKAIGDGALGISPASQVLLNDGQGTEANLVFNNVAFKALPRGKNQIPTITEVPDIKSTKDNNRPLPFEIVIGTDPSIFAGKKFVSFFTSDGGSGVDHYEIKEGDSDYKIARSPYLLSDQELHSVIRIKASDNNGNTRVETYPGVFRRLVWWISDIFKRWS